MEHSAGAGQLQVRPGLGSQVGTENPHLSWREAGLQVGMPEVLDSASRRKLLKDFLKGETQSDLNYTKIDSGEVRRWELEAGELPLEGDLLG